MKKICIIFILLASIQIVWAQRQGLELIDSLKQSLKQAPNDTNKVNLLGRLSFEYYRYNTDEGIKYANEALTLSGKLNWKKGIAFAYNCLGTNNAIKGNYPNALDYFTKSLAKYTDVNDYSMIATLSNNLGLLYLTMENYKKAEDYFYKSLAMNKKTNNKRGLALNYGNLSIIFSNQNLFDKANEYNFNALELNKEFKDKDAISRTLANISLNKLFAKDYCQALKLAMEALKISEEIKSNYNKAGSLRAIGETYYRHSIDSSADNKCGYFNYSEKASLLLAVKYLNESLKYFKIVKDLRSISETSLILSEAYNNLRDYKNALLSYQEYSTNKDSVFSKDHSIKIANLEKMREVELRDRQIKIQNLELNNKNNQILFQVILSLIIVLSISLVSFFFYKKQKFQKAVNLELDKKNDELTTLNATKDKFFSIIAHDLKNPFSSVKSLCDMIVAEYNIFTEEERKECMSQISSSVNNTGYLLENLLIWARTQRNSIQVNKQTYKLKDLIESALKPYLQFALNKKIVIENLIDEKVNITTDQYMLETIVGNLSNNSIKYSQSGNKVELSGKIVDSQMHLFIKDSGIGMDDKTISKLFSIDDKVTSKPGTIGEKGTGLGLVLCKEFIDKLNGKIEVESHLNVGTTFKIILPLN